ncbi:MAG: trypsin-like peptidase domain-containing protein [Ignavibacteriaceae bacterium]|jgi:serine protease Do
MCNRNKLVLYFTTVCLLLSQAILLSQTDYNLDPDNNINFSQEKSQADNDINNSRKNAITETVQKISPAVVGINVTAIQQVNPFGSFFNNDPFFKQFFGQQEKVKALGSGFIISPDGYIITNDHVAGNASEITVTLTNSKEYKAKLIGTDPATDICLLKIEGSDFPFIKFGNSDSNIIGEWAIAFGNPFGLFTLNDKPTVTVGVISSTGMNLEPLDNRFYLDMIQTDAAINGGNSGGPLANSTGEVIGMNTLIYTNGGTGSIGLGFAIPANKIKKIIKQLKEKGKVDRNFDIGLNIQDIDDGIANYYKLKSTRGVIVNQVIPNSPAARAGIQDGDIILQLDKYLIDNQQTLFGAFQQFTIGEIVTLKILRNNKEITKQMKLEKST